MQVGIKRSVTVAIAIMAFVLMVSMMTTPAQAKSVKRVLSNSHDLYQINACVKTQVSSGTKTKSYSQNYKKVIPAKSQTTRKTLKVKGKTYIFQMTKVLPKATGSISKSKSRESRYVVVRGNSSYKRCVVVYMTAPKIKGYKKSFKEMKEVKGEPSWRTLPKTLKAPQTHFEKNVTKNVCGTPQVKVSKSKKKITVTYRLNTSEIRQGYYLDKRRPNIKNGGEDKTNGTITWKVVYKKK